MSVLKRIPNHPQYFAHSDGLVWSVRSNKFLKSCINTSGYPQLVICGDKQRSMAVHRLIAMAFIPNPEEKREVNHKNGIKTDNRPENLEWCTRGENIRHAVENGLRDYSSAGEANGRSKLTNELVLAIRASSASCVELAKELGVNKATISKVKLRKTWKHV